MADVRRLLRNERATRHIDHPQASYSATGTLECSVCKLPLKSDVEVWNKHLKSTQHAMRVERLRISSKQPPPKPSEATSTIRETSSGSKKRKASDAEEDDPRKRTRHAVEAPGAVSDVTIDKVTAPPVKRVEIAREPPQAITQPKPQPKQTIDEYEWAAFEAFVAKEPSPEPILAPSALTAAATITAAPLTAAELAAQSREEASVQSKERREAEMEGEKEDAARALEVEFDEMEGLEERVRRLRQQREDLRIKKASDAIGKETAVEEAVAAEAGAEEESEDDEDEDFDEWGGWART